MHAVAIQDDEWDSPATVPYAGLSGADERALKATLEVLADPAVAHPAAAVSALLRHLAGREEPAVVLTLAANWLRQLARDGVRAAVVDLGVL